MTGRSPSGRAGRPPAQAPAGLGDSATIPNAGGFGGRTYSADGLVLRVEPLRTEHSDGSTGYSLGFPFAELSDFIGDSNDIAEKLAEHLSCPKRAAAAELYDACERAREFIQNGVALGYIRMPDADCPDKAHKTLPAILAALAKARGEA